MQHSSLKYILDIERVIHEIEEFKELVENDFEIYRVQVVVKRAIERKSGDHWRGCKKSETNKS
jgi:hypothetical protein